MKVVIDDDKARELFSIITNLWTKKEGVYRDIVLPQARWKISSDPKEAANWFFYCSLTQRGGLVSEDPFKWLFILRMNFPHLFKPEEVIKLSVAEIVSAIRQTVVSLKGAGTQLKLHDFFEVEGEPKKKDLYKIEQFADAWIANSRTLYDYWDSNVLNVFCGVTEFEQAFARVDYKGKERSFPGFIGMRRKIFSLFTIWLQEVALIPVFPTPFPVDFHAMRLLFATETVKAVDVKPFEPTADVHPEHFRGREFVKVTETLMDGIAKWSQGFMVKNGFSHLVVNPALWVLSRELCPQEFQNKTTGRSLALQLYYPERLANLALWPSHHTYKDPSVHCPLAAICTKAVPQGSYYSYGMLLPMPRLPYPKSLLSAQMPLFQPGEALNGNGNGHRYIKNHRK